MLTSGGAPGSMTKVVFAFHVPTMGARRAWPSDGIIAFCHIAIISSWLGAFGARVVAAFGFGVGRPTDERIDSVAEGIDPTGKKIVFDTIFRIQNHEHHSYEMWTKGPDGKKYRVMLIEYERG